MGITRKISLTTAETTKLLWHRLPYIALYSFCLAVIWIVLTFAYDQVAQQVVKAAPTQDYLKYTAFTVNNIREGEDLTYTVCREFKGNYKTTGKRTVYIVPQNKTAKDRVLLYNKDYSGVIEGDACQSYTVKDSSYHLKPGKYQLTLSGDIPVDYGILKHYFVESQPFSVYAQPAGSTDYQLQINNLVDEINDLKQRLGLPVGQTVLLEDSVSPVPAPTSRSAAPTPSVSPSVSPSASPAPASTNPCVLGLLSLCILGGR